MANQVMYTTHFGLKEPPFSITPDPRYLYMSERHREALAHLLFGIGEGGGFVQLTGEVGTGKTTVCRCLLEQLPTHVDVALILNPRLTATELLSAICDELRVPYGDARSAKQLVDVLYRRLLDAHARGRRTVLIIDEAQDLDPEVLEQVRLLTNLETPTEKLLQIILIGQPELSELLELEDLRQVAQRVTARYHLLPFSAPETIAYIRHRLAVAGQRDRIFTTHALREVHRFSRGIPRLINVICDRALLGAYANDRDRIDADTVRRAAGEVLGRRRPRPLRPVVQLAAAAAAVLMVGATLGALAARPFPWRLSRPGLLLPSAAITSGGATPAEAGKVEPRVAPAPSPTTLGPTPAPSPSRSIPTAAPLVSPTGQPRTEHAPSAAPREAPATAHVAAPRAPELLSDRSLPADRRSAFTQLYAKWGQEYPVNQNGLACEGARQMGLRCLFRNGTWEMLRRFDLPAVLELTAPTGERRYGTLVGLDAATATLEFGRRTVTFKLDELDLVWNGVFVLLWRPPGTIGMPIGPGQRGRDVEWVRERLTLLDGQRGAGTEGVYDEALRARVAAFQTRSALTADGVVGEDTLTLLTSAVRDPGIPSLAAGTR
jgi:general secretion pathway protein A